MERIRIITENTIEGLAKHRKEWDKLVSKIESVSPVQTFGWIHAFFIHKIKSRYPWVCIFAYRDEALVAVYPLMVLQESGLPGMRFRFFQLPHDLFHTIRCDGLVLPGYEEMTGRFLEHLRTLYKAIPVIRAQGIPLFSASNRCITAGSKPRFYRRNVPPEDYLKLNGDFQSYTDSLNSKFRREILRQERRLMERSKVNYRFNDIIRTNAGNAELFMEIENSGWKGKKKTSITGNPGDIELFTSATNYFSENGWMRWNFLEADNVTIAAQLAVKINKVIYLWKIGYREEYSSIAPGNLLMYRFIEDAYQQGDVEEINFMNERGWLKEWNVTKLDLVSTAIFPGIPLVSFMIRLYYRWKYRKNRI